MLSISQAKYLASLGVKKYRAQHGQFLVEGEKMVAELLVQTRVHCASIFGLERWADANAALLRPFLKQFSLVGEADLKKVSQLSTPPTVLAVAALPRDAPDFRLPARDLCFYLDGIQDPGNLGSILRVADWFGLPAVFCSPDCADAFSPKVVQASMGAIFRVLTAEIPLAELLAAAPQIPVAGAVLDEENVFSADLPSNGLLVIGNEGRGISPAVEDLLTQRLSIPRHPAGGAESLNAAIAAGIFAAAFRRGH
jgi:RNA methyltransferase, TrmH family